MTDIVQKKTYREWAGTMVYDDEDETYKPRMDRMMGRLVSFIAFIIVFALGAWFFVGLLTALRTG